MTQCFRWAILEALSFRLKHSKAALDGVATGKSEAPLVTLRRPGAFLREEVRAKPLLLQGDPSEIAWE